MWTVFYDVFLFSPALLFGTLHSAVYMAFLNDGSLCRSFWWHRRVLSVAIGPPWEDDRLDWASFGSVPALCVNGRGGCTALFVLYLINRSMI